MLIENCKSYKFSSVRKLLNILLSKSNAINAFTTIKSSIYATEAYFYANEQPLSYKYTY